MVTLSVSDNSTDDASFLCFDLERAKLTNIQEAAQIMEGAKIPEEALPEVVAPGTNGKVGKTRKDAEEPSTSDTSISERSASIKNKYPLVRKPGRTHGMCPLLEHKQPHFSFYMLYYLFFSARISFPFV
ncbi:Uncharacterized protein Rs2_35598 [Raphanus sativus]|nr:Uncharacterized protein Rs2_35598 [Raphanus sativus]